jgi:hypothetical protein
MSVKKIRVHPVQPVKMSHLYLSGELLQPDTAQFFATVSTQPLT